MRILLTADPGVPVPPKLYGGIERIVDGLAREFRQRGHQVGLAAHPGSDCAVEQFYPWPVERSAGALNTVKNTLALLHAKKNFRPDVLHSFSRLGYLLPLFPMRLPKVMSYQRNTGGRQNRIAARLGGRRFVFTGCSEYIAMQGRPWGGRWEAIHNFVDTNYYNFEPTIAQDAPLVFLSRVERIKGTHMAIKIARRAGRRLIIAGNRVDDAEGIAYWKNEVAPHLGRDGIEYIGPVNDVQKNTLLGSAAAMVVPIEWGEPFGIVFAEALACGTPVISCPLGALPEIVRPGVEGFLISSEEEGCRAVERLPEISRKACRQRAVDCFSSGVIAEKYLSLYRELVGGAK